MKNLLLTAAYNALRLYVGSGLFDRVAAQVRRLMTNDTLSGPEKMSVVLAFIQSEALTLGTTLARAVVELVLLHTAAQAATA